MKKMWLAALAVLALTSSSALAADLGQPMYKAPPPPPPPPPGWTGFYLGVNGGWGWNRRGGESEALGVGNILKPQGGLVGGQIGYNWQNGIVVWGLETDIQWADIKNTRSVFDDIGNEYSASQRLDWFGTARARLGITPWGDNTLLYVTGGLIYGEQRFRSSFSDVVADTTEFASERQTRTGGTVGAGIEYRFSPTVSGKIEGLYYNMGSSNIFLPAEGIDSHFRFEGAIVRAGLNFHFPVGGGEAELSPGQ